jgi:hypothetical protein
METALQRTYRDLLIVDTHALRRELCRSDEQLEDRLIAIAKAGLSNCRSKSEEYLVKSLIRTLVTPTLARH